MNTNCMGIGHTGCGLPNCVGCGLRPSEMEQLMGRLRIAAQNAVETDFLVDISAFNSEACPENILLILDHIEGKAK